MATRIPLKLNDPKLVSVSFELRFEARRGQRALERDVVYADIGRQMLINELQRLQNISRHQPVADAAVVRIQVKIRRDGSALI